MTSTSKKPAAIKRKTEIPPIEKDIVIRAPVEMVWAALTDPGTIGAWMDDDSVKVTLKVGGSMRYSTASPPGSSRPSKSRPCSNTPGARWNGIRANRIRWSAGSSKPEGKKTRLHLVHSEFADRKDRDDHDEGWDVYFLEPHEGVAGVEEIIAFFSFFLTLAQ